MTLPIVLAILIPSLLGLTNVEFESNADHPLNEIARTEEAYRESSEDSSYAQNIGLLTQNGGLSEEALASQTGEPYKRYRFFEIRLKQAVPLDP